MLTEDQLDLLMSVHALDFVQSITEEWPEEYQTRMKVLRTKVSEVDKEILDSFQLNNFIEIVFNRCGV